MGFLNQLKALLGNPKNYSIRGDLKYVMKARIWLEKGFIPRRYDEVTGLRSELCDHLCITIRATKVSDWRDNTDILVQNGRRSA